MGEITNRLEETLINTKMDKIDDFMEKNWNDLLLEDKEFTKFMRETITRKNLVWRSIYSAAGISEDYGNELIAQRKHTKNRDLIIRICLGAHFNLDETNRALKLYGMSPLYSRTPRDAVLIIAISHGIYDLADIDDRLAEQSFASISWDE